MHACGVQVYKGIWQGNTPVAVKFVTGHSPKERARFRNEVAILQVLGRPLHGHRLTWRAKGT